jgi:hypothetical protein
LGPLGIVFQRWHKVPADAGGETVSSFGPLPVAWLGEGHGAISISDDESVWIGFDGSDTQPCAARVLAQGRGLKDAVTGGPPTDILDGSTQNYIVVPPQYAITGCNTAPGCARQFVRISSGAHQEAITDLHLIVHPSTGPQTADTIDQRGSMRAVGPAGRRVAPPSCTIPGHVAQVIENDTFGVAAWDRTRVWRLRIEVLAGDEYERRTGKAPLAPADRSAAYGRWRMP